jgi:hypothetical protein
MAFCLGAAITASGGEQLPTTPVYTDYDNDDDNDDDDVI